MRSLWRRDDDEIARMIASIITQKDAIWNELTRSQAEVGRLELECAELRAQLEEALRRG